MHTVGLSQLCGGGRLSTPPGPSGQTTYAEVIIMENGNRQIDRRGFLGDGVRVTGAVAVTGLAGLLAYRRGQADDLVWQIDPDKCMACTNCQTHCVLDVSAVKAVQCYPLCGYCDICPGYSEEDETQRLNTAAENQLCPTGAIERLFIEARGDQRHFEYNIPDESLCIGCGKCVEGCAKMNGSLYLQVRHDRCLGCNECAIAVDCPTEAFVRVPRSAPYLLKEIARKVVEEHELKLSQQPTAEPEPAEEKTPE